MKPSPVAPFLSVVCVSFAVTLLAGIATAQSSIRRWGTVVYWTEGRQGKFVQVASDSGVMLTLRADGRIFVNGSYGYGSSLVPELPPGLVYTQACVNRIGGAALRSDGEIVMWCDTSPWALVFLPPPAPALPPGLRYEQVSLSPGASILAKRSDGVVLAWGQNQSGQCNVPSLPAGLTFETLLAGGATSYAILSDGSLIAWGDDTHGQLQVPPLPPGVTYIAVDEGGEVPVHCVALRSDGRVVAWGDNSRGQCNVPPLPPGVTYLAACAGWGSSTASRSDGVLVAWGDNTYGQGNVPTLPPGTRCVQLGGGNWQTVGLLSDGSVLSWGYNVQSQGHIGSLPDAAPFGPAKLRFVDASAGHYSTLAVLSDGTLMGWSFNGDIPPGLQGVRGFVKVAAGAAHSAALKEDGQLLCWGDNGVGQCNVPQLPAGVRYVDVAVSIGHTVALRSDGNVEAFGYNGFGECNIPPLPSGMRYVSIDCYYGRTALVRSDSAVPILGLNGGIAVTPPALPQGVEYVQVVACGLWQGALRSDGQAVIWGPGWSGGGSSTQPVPPLPSGVCYVELAASEGTVALRRSDGQVVMCGSLSPLKDLPPVLDPGTSYVQVSANNTSVLARIGPTCTYTSFAAGCAGSRPATRLVPRDTPRIGKTLQVTLFDLPADVAMMAMAFAPLPGPVSLASLGMPGCEWRIPLDAVALVAGQNQQAKFQLPIPKVTPLIGMHFFHQALVLDPAAGSSFGAVVSDAAEGVVGEP